MYFACVFVGMDVNVVYVEVREQLLPAGGFLSPAGGFLSPGGWVPQVESRLSGLKAGTFVGSALPQTLFCLGSRQCLTA